MREFCTMCGEETELVRKRENTSRDFACGSCDATMIYRALAAAMLSHFARGQHQSLKSAVSGGVFSNLDIWELAIKGPLKRMLQHQPGYVQSYFFEDLEPGETRDGVVCQDITRTTFSDQSFDLILSSEVMEHVHDPWAGFAEAARTLKIGGAYIFTIPVRQPMRRDSVKRAVLDPVTKEIVHLEPERYHKAGDDSRALVFTDFGSDIFTRLRDLGLHLCFHPVGCSTAHTNRFGAFCAVRMS